MTPIEPSGHDGFGTPPATPTDTATAAVRLAMQHSGGDDLAVALHR
ncbi:MAG TPA: hypothetical protein VG365_08335 [Solirubrobacteraceae bacterium]|nr:hypothetical protein [Solirubrobacteraceae bacterium]